VNRRTLSRFTLSAGVWLTFGAAVLQAQQTPTTETRLPPPINMEDPTWLPDNPLSTTPIPEPITPDRSQVPNSQPDGTPLRQQERTFSGTDPYNWQWENRITLRDGRTIEHTYTQSWDGSTFQSERSFAGPNGQTHNRQRTWTMPSDGGLPTESAIPTESQLSAPTPETVASPEPEGSLLEKLNPFASKTKMSRSETSSSLSASRPSGFTLGASAKGTLAAGNRSLSKGPPGQAESKARHQQIKQHLQQTQTSRLAGRGSHSR